MNSNEMKFTEMKISFNSNKLTAHAEKGVYSPNSEIEQLSRWCDTGLNAKHWITSVCLYIEKNYFQSFLSAAISQLQMFSTATYCIDK